MKKRFVSVMLIVAVMFTACFGMTSMAFAADQGNVVNAQLTVDGKEPVAIKAYYPSYTYNTYVSVEDLAWALKGTDKNFDIQKVDGTWTVTTGTDYTGAEPVLFKTPAKEDPTEWHAISFDAYSINIDGKVYELRMYDNYKYSGFDGDVEGLYMRLIDLGMFMNLSFGHEGYGQMSIDTSADFVLDLEQMDEDGYFHDLDGVYLGDVTTGEKLYGWDEDHQTEIASTSKLMTTAVVLDAIKAGKITMDTEYTISEDVYSEAQSEDGTLYRDIPSSGKVKMKVGQTWTVEDLLAALLLPSANEAGTALAEAVAGSEAEFVKLMNAKAAELGMTTAKFYNPPGLPHYTNSQYTGKMQNKMSATDMYTLCSYLLTNYYDEVTGITSQQRIYLTSLQDDEYTEGVTYGESADYTYTLEDGTKISAPYVNTTYGTLFKNIEGLIGLKTGSTNRSGSCIVVAETVEIAGEDHVIVGVSFGGEDNRQRYESSTVLLKYAQQWAAEKTAEVEAVEAATIEVAAETAKNGVKLSWTASEDVDSYTIYRSTDGQTWKKWDTTTKTTYTNAKTTYNKKYYYKVVGNKEIAGVAVQTTESNVASAKAGDSIATGVKNTTITAKSTALKNGGIKVTWTKAGGYKVDSYKLYRKVGKNGTWKLWDTTTKTSYTNKSKVKAGTAYYYKVVGVRNVEGTTVKTQTSNVTYKTAK